MLVQLGRSAQSPFCVILGSRPSFFLECSWAWDGLDIQCFLEWNGWGSGSRAGDRAHHHRTCSLSLPPGPAYSSLWGLGRVYIGNKAAFLRSAQWGKGEGPCETLEDKADCGQEPGCAGWELSRGQAGCGGGEEVALLVETLG